MEDQGGVAAEGTAAFCKACRTGNVDKVRELLSLGGNHRIDVHAHDDWAFGLACQEGHLAVIRELLALEGDRRIDVHAADDRAFGVAVQEGRTYVVQLLLALEGDRQVSANAELEWPFRYACQSGYVGVALALLELQGDRRVDVHAKFDDALHAVIRKGHLQVVHVLLGLTGDRGVQWGALGGSLLSTASWYGRAGIVHVLLASWSKHADEAKSNVEADGSEADGDGRHLSDKQVHQEVSLSEAIATCLRPALKRSLGVSQELLRFGPVGHSVLPLVLRVAAGYCPSLTGAALEHPQPTRTLRAQEVVRMVLLHILSERKAAGGLVDGRGSCVLGPTAGHAPLLDCLAVCALLPAAECNHVLPLLLQQPTTEDEHAIPVAVTVRRFAVHVAWSGLKVRSSHLHQTQPAHGPSGCLYRSGRGRLVMLRVAMRAARRRPPNPPKQQAQ